MSDQDLQKRVEALFDKSLPGYPITGEEWASRLRALLAPPYHPPMVFDDQTDERVEAGKKALKWISGDTRNRSEEALRDLLDGFRALLAPREGNVGGTASNVDNDPHADRESTLVIPPPREEEPVLRELAKQAAEGGKAAADELMTEFISKKRAANWGVVNDGLLACDKLLAALADTPREVDDTKRTHLFDHPAPAEGLRKELEEWLSVGHYNGIYGMTSETSLKAACDGYGQAQEEIGRIFSKDIPAPEVLDKLDAAGERPMWFAYDDEEHFAFYSSPESARLDAEKRLQAWRDEASEGWSDEVETVRWGRVYQEARETVHVLREEWEKTHDPEEESFPGGEGMDGYSDYTLEPKPAPAIRADGALRELLARIKGLSSALEMAHPSIAKEVRDLTGGLALAARPVEAKAEAGDIQEKVTAILKEVTTLGALPLMIARDRIVWLFDHTRPAPADALREAAIDMRDSLNREEKLARISIGGSSDMHVSEEEYLEEEVKS